MRTRTSIQRRSRIIGHHKTRGRRREGCKGTLGERTSSRCSTAPAQADHAGAV